MERQDETAADVSAYVLLGFLFSASAFDRRSFCTTLHPIVCSSQSKEGNKHLGPL